MKTRQEEPDDFLGGAATLAPDLEQCCEIPGVDPCDVACDAMPGLVLGDLTTKNKEWVVDHTRECSYCARMLGGYQEIDRVLDHLCDDYGSLIPPAPLVPTGRRAGYGWMESPVGTLMIASSEEGVCEIGFANHETQNQFLQNLRIRGFRPAQDDQIIHQVAAQLSEYFRGERNQFEVPLDFSGISSFTRSVLVATSEVPFGHLTSYRGIAERIGKPSATRAVGNALGRNPIPVVVPCHRIVRSDSSLGGYTGGTQIKQHLLALEGAMLHTG